MSVKAPSAEFAALWVAWGATFGAIEFAALRKRRRDGQARSDTLSEFVWWVGSLRVGPIPVGRLGVYGFLAWLVAHLALGWP